MVTGVATAIRTTPYRSTFDLVYQTQTDQLRYGELTTTERDDATTPMTTGEGPTTTTMMVVGPTSVTNYYLCLNSV